MDNVEAGLRDALGRDDPDAAEHIVERYGDPVYRLALRITGVKADAEEAAQDTLLTAARAIRKLNAGPAFESWIYRTAAKAAYRRLRTRCPQVNEVALDDVVPSLDDDGHFEPMYDWSNRTDEPALQGAVNAIVTEAIDALPADYRTALVLHDVEGASKPDIAEILRIDVPGVTSRVHRARLFVRKRLSEYFEGRCSGGSAVTPPRPRR